MNNRFGIVKVLITVALLIGLSISSGLLIDEISRYTRGDRNAFLDVPRAETHNVFFDLRIWTINGADCSIPIADITAQNHCAKELYVFNYPKYFLYLVRLLGIGESAHKNCGMILALAAIGCMVLMTARIYAESSSELGRYCCIFFAILWNISFPWRYAIERGQTDLILFCLITIPFIFWSGKSTSDQSSLTSLGLISALIASAFIKLFTLPSAFACVMARNLPITLGQKVSKDQILQVIAWAAIMSAVVVTLWRSFVATSGLNLAGLGGHGFGLQTLTEAGYVESPFNAYTTKYFFLAAGFSLCSGDSIRKFVNRPRHSLRAATERAKKLLISESYLCLSAMIYLPLYLKTESINYKWIFLLPLPACLSVLYSIYLPSDKRTSGGLRLLTISIVALMSLLSTPFDPTTYAYVEWLGHFALHPLCIGGLAGCSTCILLSNNRNHA